MLEDRCSAGVVLDEYSTVGYVLECLRNMEQWRPLGLCWRFGAEQIKCGRDIGTMANVNYTHL